MKISYPIVSVSMFGIHVIENSVSPSPIATFVGAGGPTTSAVIVCEKGVPPVSNRPCLLYTSGVRAVVAHHADEHGLGALPIRRIRYAGVAGSPA